VVAIKRSTAKKEVRKPSAHSIGVRKIKWGGGSPEGGTGNHTKEKEKSHRRKYKMKTSPYMQEGEDWLDNKRGRGRSKTTTSERGEGKDNCQRGEIRKGRNQHGMAKEIEIGG